MIRNKFYREVIERIKKNKSFDPYDFDILSDDTENEDYTYLNIYYKYEHSYYFKASFLQENPNIDIEVEVNPGDFLQKEEYRVTGTDKVLYYLTCWLDNLMDELLAIPLKRQMELHAELTGNLEKRLNQMIDDVPNEYISKEEGDMFRAALDKIESRFEQHIMENLSDEKELRVKIDTLKSEINTLKETLYSLTKHSWLRSLITRVANWTIDPFNQKLLKSGFAIIKPFLPEAAESVITEIEKIQE
jgi:hypothetical protein